NSPISAVRPKVPLKQLFWSKIPANNINQTVWKDIPEIYISLRFDELDELFTKNTAVSSNKSKLDNANLIAKKPLVTTLLDFNRANNIAIMLARIKMPYSEVRDAVLELDDEKLTVENLRAIKQYVPSTEEIELVREYDGDLSNLGNAEKYIKEIMVIPRLSERLTCMIFRRRFEIEAEELLPDISILRDAHMELKNSEKFKKLLKTVLAI
ncbi:9161_t:CDS:2, partial [Ambispora leptoticha]